MTQSNASSTDTTAIADLWCEADLVYRHRNGEEHTLLEWLDDALSGCPNDVDTATAQVETNVRRGDIVAIAPSGRSVEVVISDRDYLSAGQGVDRRHLVDNCCHHHLTIREADGCPRGKTYTTIYRFMSD